MHTVLAGLDPQGPPVVVVQHMPGQFLVSFARQLNQRLEQDVALARADEPLKHGQVRVAPGLGQHTEITKTYKHWSCQFRDNTEGSLYCPSVEALFKSATPYASLVVGVILTGLGRDGADSLLELRQGGARTIGQDEATSTVYGMPKAAYRLGAVEQQLPLGDIPAAVITATQTLTASPKNRRST